MVSTPRKPVVPTVEPQFSLLTCLFVGGCFLFLETLVDLVCHIYGHRSALLWFIIHTNNHLLDDFGLPHFYSYAMDWWTPLIICCVFFGYRLGWRGMMYTLCGTVILLVIIHNFRGVTMRANVFEAADDIQRWHSAGESLQLPDPWFWDMGYFVVALIGSLLGWILCVFSQQSKRTEWCIGSVSTLWLGYACLLLGVVETGITLLIVQPQDLYINLPITHGYALMAFGLVMVASVRYRQRLSEYLNLEIV